MIPYGICTVLFLNGEDYSKPYNYFVNEKMFRTISSQTTLQPYDAGRQILIGCELPTFTFENEQGYNYRGSTVVAVNLMHRDSNKFRAELQKGNITRWISKIQPKSHKTILGESFFVYCDTATYEKETRIEALFNSEILKNLNCADISYTISNEGIRIENLPQNKMKEKEENTMNNFMKNLKFGAVSTNEIRMSAFGPAFRTQDGWLAWSDKDNTYIDASDLIFDMDNFCYMAPVAKTEVKIGDFIYHHNSWLRVIGIREDGRVAAEVILNQTETTLIPTKNVFGFDFYTKLISFGGNMFNANADTPFGNMLPFLMMKGEDNSMLPMLMMMNGVGTVGKPTFDMSNPMFLYLMLNKGDESTRDMLMLMAMQNFNAAAPSTNRE